jgi:hypothetical protein
MTVLSAQSRAHVIVPPPGAFVMFPTRERR